MPRGRSVNLSGSGGRGSLPSCCARRTDHGLIEPFLSGMPKGVAVLRRTRCGSFVQGAFATHPRHPRLRPRALALGDECRAGALRLLQVSVGCGQMQDRLRRYLNARTGLAPRDSAAVGFAVGAGRHVECRADGMLRPRGHLSPGRDRPVRPGGGERTALPLLVRLEASFHEFGTFDFDLEKALELCPPGLGDPPDAPPDFEPPDIGRFLSLFPDPGLAGDLFTTLELGRIRRCLAASYPGLVRRWYPLLQAVFRAERPGASADPLGDVFERVGLGQDSAPCRAIGAEIACAFAREVTAASPVEAVAALTARFYPSLAGAARTAFLSPPFGWRPWPNPAAAGEPALERTGARILRADVRSRHTGLSLRHPAAADGRRRPTHPARPARDRPSGGFTHPGAGGVDPLRIARVGTGDYPAVAGRIHRYPEWDDRLGDYLPEHVRLRVHRAPIPARGRVLRRGAPPPDRAGRADPPGVRATAPRGPCPTSTVGGRG